jgi:hypothetical protein
MRKHATTLLAPLAALAIAGTVGTAPAQAHGDDHGDHSGGEHGDTRSAEIVTDEDAAATLAEAGVTLDAVDPATAEEQEDGTTELTFPHDENGDARSEDKIDFLGGVEYSSEAGTATWADPSLDTSDWLVSFEVDGQRTDLLQVVPENEGDDGDDGDDGEGDHDLALTAEGADALNEVAGDESFAEGDILASTDDGMHC